MVNKTIVSPPFEPLMQGSYSPASKTKGQLTEHVAVRWSGSYELRSFISIEDAGDSESAWSGLRATSLVFANSPGDGPFKISITYDPIVIMYNGSVEDECGFSHIFLQWRIASYLKIWLPHGRPGMLKSLDAFTIFSSDDASWNTSNPLRKYIAEFDYVPKFNPPKGFIFILEAGLQLGHNTTVDDVSVSSMVDVTAAIDKIHIEANH